MRAVAQRTPALAARLGRILQHYDRLVTIMTAQPTTLVHGSFRSQNILVDLGATPARICPIDWELAACGAPLYDLAFLSDGFQTPQREILWDAYRQQAEAHGLQVPATKELQHIIDCFRLHKTLKSLSESASKQFPEKTVAKLVGIAEELNNNV